MWEQIKQQINAVMSLAGEDAWILQIFSIIFIALLLDFIVKRLLKRLQGKLEKTKTVWDDAFFAAVRVPISVMIWVLGLSFALDVLDLAVAETIREVGIIFNIAWALVRFVGQVEERIIRQGELMGEIIDRTTADAIAQLLKVSVVITAILVGLQTLGFNISAILAFGGIGGIAVGFAAKDLLSNFFGGLMIYLDRPFAVGDWIRSPDRNIEGTVEQIGWRRPLYIPNSVFATIAVENPSRMLHRRIYETIGVRYDDVDKLPAIVDDVKSMLQQHQDIAQDQTLIVNFNTFSASSLDFFVYTFTKTTDWVTFHQIKQDVLFKISEIVTKHNAEMAFPTSTLHIPEGIELQGLEKGVASQ